MRSTLSLLVLWVFAVPSVILACDQTAVSGCSSDYATALTNLGSSVNFNNFCSELQTYISCLNTACSSNVPQMYVDLISQSLEQSGFACDISSLATANGGADTNSTENTGGSGSGGGGNNMAPTAVCPVALLAMSLAFVFVLLRQ